MAEIKIRLDDKPHLSAALLENPALAKEVIQTFVALAEEAFDPAKGITWAELPAMLHRELTFADLIRGILRGSLDLKEMNPDAFDALREEVHPLSMLSSRKNYLDDTLRVYNWRAHFRLEENDRVSEQTVAKIFRRILRYAKYVNVEQLAQALMYKQEATFRGLGERNVAMLPMYPALRYQQEHFGDLHVGKFYDDVGFLDCGSLQNVEEPFCPACLNPEGLKLVGRVRGCMKCNAGFTE